MSTSQYETCPVTGEEGVLDHALLPVANEDGVLATATALEPDSPDRVTAVHAVGKGGDVPGKTPVEQSEESADESCVAVRTLFPDADERTAYGREIFEGGTRRRWHRRRQRPRDGSRIGRFRSPKLVESSDRPVTALQNVDSNE